MKPITVAILLMASVPANYFAFDFASKHIEYFKDPIALNGSENNIEYCIKEKDIDKKTSKNMSTKEQRIAEEARRAAEEDLRLKRNIVVPETTYFISNIRRNVEINWGNLINIHGINHQSYGGCETTLNITLSPIGSFYKVSIQSSSGDNKFDDIAILSILHTNFEEEFGLLPKNIQRNYRQFRLRFSLDRKVK